MQSIINRTLYGKFTVTLSDSKCFGLSLFYAPFFLGLLLPIEPTGLQSTSFGNRVDSL